MREKVCWSNWSRGRLAWILEVSGVWTEESRLCFMGVQKLLWFPKQKAGMMKIALHSWVYSSDFPAGTVVKDPLASTEDAGDVSLTPGSVRSPGEGNGNHSSILARKTPWTEEPGGLQSMGSQRVRHN